MYGSHRPQYCKGDCSLTGCGLGRGLHQNGALSVQAKIVPLTPRREIVAAGDCFSDGGSRQVTLRR